MADQKPSPWQQHMEFEKKLRKQEQRAQKRLQDAQERLRRAEVRVQKRKSRIERLEGRLTFIRQQLDELFASRSVAGARSNSEKPQRADTLQAEETAFEQQQLTDELLAGAGGAATAPSAKPIPVSADELEIATAPADTAQSARPRMPASSTEANGFARIARAVADAAERAARMAMQRAVDVASRLEQMSASRYAIQELIQTQSATEQTSVAAQEAERLATEARSQAMNMGGESQQAETAVTTEDQQFQLTSPSLNEGAFTPSMLAASLAGEQQADQSISQVAPAEEPTEPSMVGAAHPGDSAADKGSSDDAPFAESLSGGQITQEEKPQATPLITQAGELSQESPAAPQLEETLQEHSLITQAGELPQASASSTPHEHEGQASQPLLIEEAPQEDQPSLTEEVPQSSQLSTVAREEAQAAPSLVDRERIEEIEEEDEVVSAVAAMMIADVAAAAAAEAEALAEASGARTREARLIALQVDQVLEEVRAAIKSGALTGEDAEVCLRDAEGDATRAHALLADAEAAEEQAVNAARNAEAEAEVAEGMAFASSDRAEMTFEELTPGASTLENAEMVSDDETDITQEMPVVRLQEPE